VETALSLLRFRQDFLGSFEPWWSLKPLEYEWLKNEPYWVQAAGQAYFLDKALSRELAGLQGRNVVDLEYQQLCSNPRLALQQVRDMLGDNGQDVDLVGEIPRSIPQSSRTYPVELRSKVERALESFYNEARSEQEAPTVHECAAERSLSKNRLAGHPNG
jgi:hypothetical protein